MTLEESMPGPLAVDVDAGTSNMWWLNHHLFALTNDGTRRCMCLIPR